MGVGVTYCSSAIARISDDASGAQGPRTVLHPALKPPDYVLLCHHLGHVVEQQRFVVEPAVRGPDGVQEESDLLVAELRTQQRSALRVAGDRRPWLLKPAVPHVQRCS